MSNMLTATVAIQGTRPLLWHHFGPDALPLLKLEKSGVPGHDPEEWRRTVLMTADRQLYLLPSYVFAAVRDGARYTKRGRGTLQAVVAATLQVTDDRVLVDRFVPTDPIPTDSDSPVYVDVRMVRNPTTKARNVRYRIAAAKGWKVDFNILWDRTVVSRGEMEAVLSDAGKLAGIADARTIGFGRFEVVDLSISEA